jgi:Do/DeqQ family serine protease
MSRIIGPDFAKTLLAALLGSGLTFGAFKAFDDDQKVVIERAPENYTRMAANVSSPAGPNAANNPDFSYAAELANPTVVHIRAKLGGERLAGRQRQELPSPFRDFFGDEFNPFEGPQRGPGMASGSGVIISEDGYIVTNNHVVENSSELEVSLYDKRTFKAKVIGTDPSTDLALIKIDEKGLPKTVFGNSDNIKVGQWVLAVGNPFNLESTVTAGIVSAKGRNIGILDRDRDRAAIESFIQTDAAVNPGNSGGALVNLNGELIGINTAIASNTGSYQGYSFAVPSNIASKVVEDLIKFGNVQRAFLGVTIRDVNGSLAEEKNLKVFSGIYVDSLLAEGSAKAAGIQVGDVITKVDDRPVNSVAELQEQIARHRPGDKVTVTLIRKGSELLLNVPLRNREGTTAIVKDTRPEVTRALGADFETLPAKDLSKLNLKHGVRVKNIGTGILRSETEMRSGFIITEVNKTPVKSKEQLIKMLEDQEGGVMIAGVYPDSNRKYYYAFGMEE